MKIKQASVTEHLSPTRRVQCRSRGSEKEIKTKLKYDIKMMTVPKMRRYMKTIIRSMVKFNFTDVKVIRIKDDEGNITTTKVIRMKTMKIMSQL